MSELCQGNCFIHSGERREVYVYNPKTAHRWGTFTYCDYAVKIDQERGFKVFEIAELTTEDRAAMDSFPADFISKMLQEQP